MQRKFLTNLALLLFLNFLIKPFWILGIDRTVQNVVGLEDYGFYFIVFNFSLIFNILFDFGITNFNNRNIAQHNFLLNKYFSGIVLLKLLFAVVYVVVVFSIALIMGWDKHQLILLCFLAFNQFLLSFILYLRSNISGLLLFKTDSVLSVLDRMLMIIICGVLLWGNVTRQKFQIEWFVYAQTAGYVLTALTALIIVVKKAHFKRLRWNRPFFILIIKQSFPFAVLIFLMTCYNRVDSIMLKILLPENICDEQAGIYAHGFRLLDASNMIAFLFAVLLMPIFSKMIKMKDSVEQLVKLAFTLLITISVIVAAGSFFYSYELMDLLYDSEITESAEVFKLIMGGFIAISTTYVFGTLLTANGSLKQLNIVAACGVLLNLILNIILVPRLLAVGSAYASLITQFIIAIIQVIIVQSIFKFKINYKFLLSIVFFIPGVILINVLSKKMQFSWEINFIFMVAISLLYAFTLKLLSIKSFIKILKE